MLVNRNDVEEEQESEQDHAIADNSDGADEDLFTGAFPERGYERIQ